MKRLIAMLGMMVFAAITPAFAQGPASQAAAPTVVDSKGHVVGSFILTNQGSSNSLALREISGLWFALPVTSAGFLATGVIFYYPSSNCTGTAYIATGYSPGLAASDTGSGLGPQAYIVNETLYYTSSPQSCSALTFGSWQGTQADGALGACNTSTSSACDLLFNLSAGTPTAFDLSTLGLVPPFRIMLK